MFDSNGEITPPCGVPASASLDVAARTLAPSVEAFDAPLRPRRSLSVPGACYRTVRLLSGRDSHPLVRCSGNDREIVRQDAPCWEVYRRRFVSTRLAATLLADGAPCFAICACPALVIKRDCSYISIHFSLEIAEISLPIASSGKSSGDSK